MSGWHLDMARVASENPAAGCSIDDEGGSWRSYGAKELSVGYPEW
jgi:hypothetical protein